MEAKDLELAAALAMVIGFVGLIIKLVISL